MNEKQPHEMTREEFAAWYREGQERGFAEYLEKLRAEIGDRTPRYITIQVPATPADRKLMEQIKELAGYEEKYRTAPLPYLDPKQLAAQRAGWVEDARRKGIDVPDWVLAEVDDDDPQKQWERAKVAEKREKRRRK